MSKVYIKVDENNRITACDGGYTMNNVNPDTWTFIDEGEGDKYNLCQSHYLSAPITADDGTHNYVWENDQIRLATEAEHEAELASFPAPAPAQEDMIEAQIMYTALMTDTLL